MSDTRELRMVIAFAFMAGVFELFNTIAYLNLAAGMIRMPGNLFKQASNVDMAAGKSFFAA